MDMSLSDVCYEQIRDQYWYGLYGSFKLIIDRNTSCFNATKLCQQGGKQFTNWFRNKQTKELIEYYRNKSGGVNTHGRFIEIKKGGKDAIDNEIISGTYLQKELILSLATWISKDFYHKCSTIIESYFISEFNEKYKNDVAQLHEQLQRIQYEMERLRLENEQLKITNEGINSENEQLKIANERYRNFEEDIAFKTINMGKLHKFVLIRTNSSISDFSMYVMRTQRRNYENNMRRLNQKFPNMEIIFELEYNPNSINLFNRIKERVPNINVHYNKVKLLNGYTEEQFVQEIIAIANSDTNLMTE